MFRRRQLDAQTSTQSHTSLSPAASSPGPARRARRRKAADPAFSPKRCKTPLQRFASACRLIVHEQIEAFRDSFFQERASPRCPVTDEPLERTNCHVHHDGASPTAFHDLVQAFVREHKINLSRIEYLAGRVLDESLRSAFDAFHKEHARLRIVSATANLSDLRKGRF